MSQLSMNVTGLIGSKLDGISVGRNLGEAIKEYAIGDPELGRIKLGQALIDTAKLISYYGDLLDQAGVLSKNNIIVNPITGIGLGVFGVTANLTEIGTNLGRGNPVTLGPVLGICSSVADVFAGAALRVGNLPFAAGAKGIGLYCSAGGAFFGEIEITSSSAPPANTLPTIATTGSAVLSIDGNNIGSINSDGDNVTVTVNQTNPITGSSQESYEARYQKNGRVKTTYTEINKPTLTFSTETFTLSNEGASAGYTVTATTNNKTGASSYQLITADGTPIASGSNYTLATNGNIAFTNGTAQQVFNLNTGKLIFQVDADGAGFIVGADGNDQTFSAGQLQYDSGNGTLTTSVNGETKVLFGTPTSGDTSPSGMPTTPTPGWGQPSVTINTVPGGITRTTVTLGNGVSITTDRDSDRRIIKSTTVTPALDDAGNPIANTFDLSVHDAQGVEIATGRRLNNPVTESYEDSITPVTPPAPPPVLGEDTPPPPPAPATIVTETAAPQAPAPDTAGGAGTAPAPAPVPKIVLSASALNNLNLGASILLDVNTITHSPTTAGKVVGVLNGTNNIVLNTGGQNVALLSNVSNAIGGFTGIQGLSRAWKAGDVPGVLLSANGVASSFGSIYALSMGYTPTAGKSAFQWALSDLDAVTGESIFGGAGSGLQGLNDAVPYISAISNILNGNISGAAGSAIGSWLSGGALNGLGLAAGPVGAILGLALTKVFDGLFGSSPPVPVGTAVAIRKPDGTFSIEQIGSVAGGGDVAQNKLAGILNSTGGVFKIADAYNQDIKTRTAAGEINLQGIGLIPQRLGSVIYSRDSFLHSNGSAGMSFGVNATDPATGQDPGIRFDTDAAGRAVNVKDASNPAYFQSIEQYYNANALARGALAPLWEVATAKQQAASNVLFDIDCAMNYEYSQKRSALRPFDADIGLKKLKNKNSNWKNKPRRCVKSCYGRAGKYWKLRVQGKYWQCHFQDVSCYQNN